MSGAAGDLRRHIPRVALTWDDESPGTQWRAIDGTLVFADISGFTALTERLSARGRIGAEEIIETLNRVFGGMLDSSAAWGADLLKFGGDALLFLFRGDGHAQRAVDAAVEMRTALRAAAAVPTSVGRLRLSMSVGIHSGDVHLFLVGSPSRELLILGPAATATAQAEAAATAGEIVVTASTAQYLPPATVKARDDGRYLVARRKPHGDPLVPPRPKRLSQQRITSLFPNALGTYLNPGVPDPEHRVATIGFVRFSGTDALLRSPGPDAVARTVDTIVTEMERCLAGEDVTLLATDIDSDGAKFFLASGVPQASEDDEGRMLRALRRFIDTKPPLPVQAGVNRGHVFVAEVGSSTRAAYSAMGDTTNTAARIAAKAGPSQLFAHPSVLEHSMTLFTTAPEGPFPMKGKALPLLVYSVGEEAGTREVGDAARLPFRGRDSELAVVQDVLESAMDGTGGVVTVVGPTGIGKSRLVHEASDAVPDLAGFVLRAEPYGQSSSYRVLRDPVRALLGVQRGKPEDMGRTLLETLERVAPELLSMAPLLADVASVDVPSTPEVDALDAQFRPDVLADTLVQLLGIVKPGPMIIVADGAQWIDQASARLLDRIAWASAERPWGVVIIRRGESEGFTPSLGEQVVLEPLANDVIEQLVYDATDAAPLRPHEVAAIVSRAEGNPLFVEEVTRVARAVGSLEAMPESLGAAMSVQIDLLAPTARRVLRYASVLGRTFRREVLRETLAEESIRVDHATISQLSDFLEADGPQRFRFRNSLLRDAAYEELAYRTRARLHQGAGLAMEKLSDDLEVDSPMLALHFSRSGDHDRAWRYGRMAGEVSRRSYALVEAAAQFESALDAARQLDVPADERIEVWSILGEVSLSAGNLDEAATAFRRAAQLADFDRIRQARLTVRRARVLSRAGRFPTALRVRANALRVLGDATGQEAERVRVLADSLLSLIRIGQERPADARSAALSAAEGARRVGEYETLARALMDIDDADHQLGVPSTGSHTQEALDICVQHGLRYIESHVRLNLGVWAFFAGDWDQAVDYYRSSRDVSLLVGNSVGAAETDVNLGEILVNRGELSEAERILRNAIRVLRVSQMEWESTYGELMLARAYVSQGRSTEADELLAVVVQRFLDLKSPTAALEALLVQADVALRSGDPDRSLRLVAEGEAATGGHRGPLAARMALRRADAYLHLGKLAEGEEALQDGLRLARDQQQPLEEAELLRTHARLASLRGDHAVADQYQTASDAIAERLRVRL